MEDNASLIKSEVADTLNRNRGSSKLTWLKRLGISVVFLGAATAVLLWLFRGTPAVAPQFKTEQVRRGNLEVSITATGSLAPVNQVEVGSELSGIVKSVEVDYNDQVRAGQILARLDTSKLEAQVLQSRANLVAARAKTMQTKATLKESAANLERLQSLFAMSQGRAVSKHDLEAAGASLERARADQASAEASVNQNEAAIKAIETDLAKTVIHSPINGVVLSRSVDPGQTVAASLQAPVLFTLAEDLAKMELHVDVDEADVGHVKAGQNATFSVDAYPDRDYPARISQVRYGSKTVDGVVTYETVLAVDNSDFSLRPGMTATANIIVKEVRDALLVPNAALRFVPPVRTNADTGRSSTGGSVLSRLFPRPRRAAPARRELSDRAGKKGQRVWIERDGILTPIPVTTGATDGSFTEVTATNLQIGQELVVDSVPAK